MGTLRISVEEILTPLFATYADILTCVSSIRPLGHTSAYNTTLLYQYLYSAASVMSFSPVHFRRTVT